MGLYTAYNGKPLEGFKWRSDMICLCSKHYGCYVKNRLRRATDSKTSWEVIAIIHMTYCDGSNQSGSSEDGKQWLDSALGWKLQNLLSPACGCVLRPYYRPFRIWAPFTSATSSFLPAWILYHDHFQPYAIP